MDAKEIQQRIQELMQMLAGQSTEQITLAPVDVLAEFAIAQRARGYAETTIRNRTSILGSLERIAGRPLLELDYPTLSVFLGRPNVRASTRRISQVTVQAFYRWAHANRYRLDDPTTTLQPVRVPKGRPRPFSAEQVEAMLTTGAYRRTRAMILVGYFQGFRVSQIARVHGHDVDILGRTIRTSAKGGKDRRLPLHPVIAELALTMPRHDHWFPARHDEAGPISGAGVTNLITRAKKRAGITDPKLTPHSLRHSFATHLVDGGVDIRVIQELLLHDSLSTTQVYAGVSEGLKRKGIEALAAMEIPKQAYRARATTEAV